MKPLISVVIPVHNCENTIGDAVASILNQTYPNLEVIIANDNSTDGTKDILERLAESNHKLKIVDVPDDPGRFDPKTKRNINAGYSARNEAFKYTRGEYITFQDADDTSFLNRIEVQYDLLTKYGSTHLTIDWVRFDEKYIGKKLNVSTFPNDFKMLSPKELYKMSQRSKGLVAKISTVVNEAVPFSLKRKKIINKLFFGSLENYPGQGNSPLFKREVADKISFRKLSERIWPSFMGRGADKDFNFQVAETFKNSHVLFIPLYMWRVKDQNERYPDGIGEFLI